MECVCRVGGGGGGRGVCYSISRNASDCSGCPGECDESVTCLPSDCFLTGKTPKRQTDAYVTVFFMSFFFLQVCI